VLHASLTRRRLVTGAGALSLAALAARPAMAQEGATPASSALGPIPAGGENADGSWSFTDDRGVTIDLPATPTKVVAYVGIAAALHDFGFEVVGYFRGEEREATDIAKLAPDFPADTVADLGFGDALDIEQMVALGTELFVGANYGVDGGQTIWPIQEDVIAQVSAFAGVAAIAFADGTDTARTIETVGNLAAALGVAPDETVTGARDAFEAARTALETATAAKPGLTAMFMSGWASGYYVGMGLADITLYQQDGLASWDPGTWDEQSWEVFAEAPVDLIFLDNRGPQWWQPEQLEAEIPTWPEHPAVTAGQVFPWQNEYVPSYQGFTPVLEGVVSAIEEAEPLAG